MAFDIICLLILGVVKNDRHYQAIAQGKEASHLPKLGCKTHLIQEEDADAVLKIRPTYKKVQHPHNLGQ